MLKRLRIHNVRLLKDVEILPSSGINLFQGQNGMGKTSVLEAIYLLSRGHSFRSGRLSQLCHYDESSLYIHALLHNDSGSESQLGLMQEPGKTTAKLNGQSVNTIAELSFVFPVLVLHPESYLLITGEPSLRRAFLDWGCFYTDERFFQHWKQYRRLLKQRNQLLREGKATAKLLAVWDQSLVESADALDKSRKVFFDEFLSLLFPLLTQLLPEQDIALDYSRGWDAGGEFSVLLRENLQSDIKRGFSQIGPHRADIRFQLNGKHAAKSASRGQLKALVSALVLTQALIVKLNAQQAVLLLDDLPSEIDSGVLQRFMDLLSELELQTFISCIACDSVIKNWSGEYSVFHVEHGKINLK